MLALLTFEKSALFSLSFFSDMFILIMVIGNRRDRLLLLDLKDCPQKLPGHLRHPLRLPLH